MSRLRNALVALSSSRRLIAGLVLILLFSLIAIEFSAFRDSRALRRQIEQSYAVQFDLDRLLALHQDVETGQRGFSITGKTEFLQPFDRAVPQIAQAFRDLARDSQGLPAASAVPQLEALSKMKILRSRHVIEVRRTESLAAASELIAEGTGKRLMDALRARLGSLRAAEVARQQSLLSSYADSTFNTQLSTAFIQLLLLLLLGAAALAYSSNFARLKAASARAQDSSNRQSAIFNASSDAMLVVDEHGCVESLNPSAERLFAREAADLVGTSVTELFEGGTLYIQGFNERRKETRGSDQLRQLSGIRADNSRFEAEIAASTVQLADGARTLLLVRDATERMRVERMKNEFVSTVSHELRTPLTSIRGALSLLDHAVGGDLPDKPRQLVKIAKSNSERLSLLVDDILDIEKIDGGRLELNLQPMDVRDVVAQAEEQNHTYAADREVRLMVTCQAEPLIVLGDASRLLQALTNLISNAAKFSPSGGIVSIIAERLRGVARISVADQGSGIPREFQPHLFGRFSQALGQASQRSGTGLGLAITKAIVEQHGGTISYETSLGKGTRFWIDLPLAKEGTP